MAEPLFAFSAEDAEALAEVVRWWRHRSAPAFGPRGAAPVVQDGGDRLVKVTSATAGDHGLYPAKLQDGVWTWLDPSFPADADAPDCWLMMRNVELAEVGKTYFARRLSLHDDGSLIYCYASPDPDPFISVDGTSPGTGDSAVAAFQVKTLHVYLGSGLGIANPSTGVGEISLQPASHVHAGGVDLTDGQWLGANTKLLDKVQVGVSALETWPDAQTKALVRGKLRVKAGGVAPDSAMAVLEGANGRVVRLYPDPDNATYAAWWVMEAGATDLSGTAVWARLGPGAVFNVDAGGAFEGLAVYACRGTQGVTGGYKSVTTTGGIVTGGTASGTGFSGTIGG